MLSIKVQHIACGDSFSIVAGTVRENSSTTAKFQILAGESMLFTTTDKDKTFVFSWGNNELGTLGLGD